MKALSPAFIACMTIFFGEGLLAAEQVNPKVGTHVSEFELAKVTDGTWKLSDAKDAKLVVIAFIGTECPLVQHYGTRFAKLAEDWSSRGVQFVAIDANVQDSREEVARFAEKFGMTFPVLKDDGSRIADLLGATRTPQVTILDDKRTIRYSGPIDDQGAVGYFRVKFERDHVTVAIKELLDGQPVSQPDLPPIGCLIGRKLEASEGPVTYAKQISRIFNARCVECHRAGEIGPFAMDNYDDVVGWADMIGEVVSQERMPPWFANPEHGEFKNDPRLTAEEKKTIALWVNSGAPMGDLKDLPAAPVFENGWRIGKPDVEYAMADKPFAVPKAGTIPYQHYVIDPEFSDEKWIVGCECRPGNRSVVHHVLVFCMPPGTGANIRDLSRIFYEGGLIAAYGPGSPGFQAPSGAGFRIPAGSKILVQMHYTPNGRLNQEDMTTIGFQFGDEKSITSEIQCRGAHNELIFIKPNVADHRVDSQYVFEEDRILYNMAPHMHMRGKSFTFRARYPDGRSEVLLDVPRFDFNWQIQYDLARPKLLPKGTVLKCEAHYDNSRANAANPAPDKFVTFGEQTWDEMMIGWFTAMSPREDSPRAEDTRAGNEVSAR